MSPLLGAWLIKRSSHFTFYHEPENLPVDGVYE
jgi:hypothetical protein